MTDQKKRASGWFARWRERRRESARRAGEIQARSREVRRGNFDKAGSRGAGDGPGGGAGGF
jgi:hypothetical protein